ncbi:restriction endonuclease [bacterium]|nr:restriction endonuclease [bacterium]
MSNRSRKLFYGDCLSAMRDHIPDESADLVYLDPPFNSKATYNVLFKPPTEFGEGSQIKAFDDTWHWNLDAEREYELVRRNVQSSDLANLIEALRRFLNTNDMLAYLVHMANRLLEVRRVMKDTASVYLHCDPTASHYLKLVMDAIFGKKNFRNEIIWAYRGGGTPRKDFGRRHDVILRFSKSKNYRFYDAEIRIPYQAEGIDRKDDSMWGSHKGTDKVYKPHPKGKIPEDWWLINVINANSPERLGYPTQKPQTLLERIIKASSEEGDVVLDPFCGCGTSIHASEALKRNWIGIDITHLAITLVKKRLADAFGELPIETHGLPTSYAGAMELARQDKHQFELWVIGLINAQPYKGGRKGADTGIDGYLRYNYLETGNGKQKIEQGTAIIEVKGGQTGVKDIRNLSEVVSREEADQGILISAVKPTKKMLEHASAKGFVKLGTRDYPIMQVVWLKDLMEDTVRVEYPESGWIDHTKTAPREKGINQTKLDD